MWSIKRIGMYTNVIILSVFIIGCDKSSNNAENRREDSKEEQIKKSFAKTLDMYPIKNLEDLYDKEGYRDGEFEKGNKGTWVCIQLWQGKGESLKSRGMILKLDME